MVPATDAGAVPASLRGVRLDLDTTGIAADGYEPVVTTATLTVTEVHVVIGPADPTYAVKDGTNKAPAALQVTNLGREPVSDFTYYLVGEAGVTWRPTYGPGSNCKYGGDGAEPFHGREMYCDLYGFVLQPGQTYRTDSPFLMAQGGQDGAGAPASAPEAAAALTRPDPGVFGCPAGVRP